MFTKAVCKVTKLNKWVSERDDTLCRPWDDWFNDTTNR